MKKKITIKDIAKEAGVSPALVSFALRNNELNKKQWRISEKTAKKILDVVAKYDYKPNITARSLRTKSTKTIGVIISDISNPFFSSIARQMEDCAYKLGYTIFFGSSDEQATKLDNLVTIFLDKGVDGLIVVPCENSDATIKKILRSDVPLVLLDREVEQGRVSSVLLDNVEASKEMVQYLHSWGRRRVCMISYDMRISNIRDRERGFLQETQNLGLEGSELKRVRFYHIEEDMKKIIESEEFSKYDSILFTTNFLAYAGLQILLHNGTKIPDDVMVVTYDNNSAYDLYGLDVPYAGQPINRLVEESLRLLIGQIDKSIEEPERILVKAQFNCHKK